MFFTLITLFSKTLVSCNQPSQLAMTDRDCEGECKSSSFCLYIFLACYVSSVLIEQWRKGYNQERPYNAFGYRQPAPEAILTLTTT
jgi:hypothetical protein